MDDPLTAPVLLVADDGPVRILTLNRPERRNALDLELRERLGDAIEAAMAEVSVRALVIAGAGGSFCAGGDLTTMEGMTSAAIASRIASVQRVAAVIRGGTIPVVAAVKGAAVGAGLSLALACDRVVAGRGARLGAVFSRVGLAADMGISMTLPERVGVARARQMLLLGDVVEGDEALALGLIDALVESGTAVEAALADARRLAAAPPLAVGAIKRLLGAPPVTFDEGLIREGAEQQALLASADLAEGVAAFRERRPPQFEGR